MNRSWQGLLNPNQVLALLVLTAGLYGAWIWHQNQSQAQFYQVEFDSAVALACGKGFKGIENEALGAASGFLSGKKESISCEEVFSQANHPLLIAPNWFQTQTTLLQYIFAALWASFGFSWGLSAIVAGGLLALTTLSLYVFARLLLGAWPSVLLAGLAIMDSGLLTLYLPHLRDFSKAPFIILLTAATGFLLLVNRGKVIGIAAASALLTATGIGFRPDVSMFLILIPIALVIRGLATGEWRCTALAFVTFIGVMVAYDSLILSIIPALGINNAHYVILGHATQFMAALGFEETYQGAMYFYNDIYVLELVRLHAAAFSELVPNYATPVYDAAGRAVLFDYLRTFPANELMVAFTALHRSLFGFVGPSGSFAILLGVTFIITGCFRWRGMAVLLLLMFLGGLSGVQFDPRHYFYLPWLGASLIAASAAVGIFVLLRRLAAWGLIEGRWILQFQGSIVPEATELSWRWGVASVAFVVSLFPAVEIARVYQGIQLDRSIVALDSMARGDPLPPTATAALESGSFQRTFNGAGISTSSYISIALREGSGCGEIKGVSAVYEATSPYYDWSFDLKLPHGLVSAAYFPLPKFMSENRIVSITVDVDQPSCNVDVFRIRPDRRFLPLVYLKGTHDGPVYHRNPALAPLVAAVKGLALSAR